MSSTQRRRAPVEDEPAGGRRSEADDPAAALRARTRRRLIGATALLVGAVIVLPMLLDTAPRPVPDNIAITVAIPSPARPDDRPAPVAERREAEPAAPVTEPAQPPAEPAPPPVEAPAKVDPKPDENAVLYLVLSLFGLFIVTMAILQSTANRLRGRQIA